MKRLILIDGNAILHRAYHALPPLTTKKGEPINAVYGLVSMLLRVIQDLKPAYIAVCFDRPEPTFRQKQFASYQAQRPPMEKNLSSQFSKAKDIFTAMKIPIYEMAGYEADDIIGTLAEIVASEKLYERVSDYVPHPEKNQIVIVTGDRDILQLVNDERNIQVYMPIKGLTDAKLMKEEDVVKKFGVKPDRIPDYKALVGDPSDNYPGVAGIGPKTAVDLLQRFRSLEQIYKNLDKINPKVREKLEKGKKDAFLSLKLAMIVRNVDLEIDLEETGKWKLDDKALLDLFAEYGFKTLAQRVKSVSKKIEHEIQMKLL